MNISLHKRYYELILNASEKLSLIRRIMNLSSTRLNKPHTTVRKHSRTHFIQRYLPPGKEKIILGICLEWTQWKEHFTHTELHGIWLWKNDSNKEGKVKLGYNKEVKKSLMFRIVWDEHWLIEFHLKSFPPSSSVAMYSNLSAAVVCFQTYRSVSSRIPSM